MQTQISSLALLGLAVVALTACPGPDHIVLDPTDLQLDYREQTRSIGATPMNHQGREFPMAEIVWSSDDPSVATVDEDGRVTAVASGRTRVYARIGDLEARTLVRVRLVEELAFEEEEMQLSLSDRRRQAPTVVALDIDGRQLEGRRIELTSRDRDIVTIDGRGGLHPHAAGETVVEAVVDGLRAELPVEVRR